MKWGRKVSFVVMLTLPLVDARGSMCLGFALDSAFLPSVDTAPRCVTQVTELVALAV